MKIIILSPSNNVVGGVEHFCDYLKNVYQNAGHEVVVLVGSNDPVFSKIFSLLGLGAPYLGWQLGRLVRKETCDVLVTNGFLGWNVKKGNIINVQHGTFAASADRIDKRQNSFKWFVKKYIWGYFEKLAAQNANVVVAVSEETASSVKKYYSIKEVEVIANSVDFEMFSKKDQLLSRKKFLLPEDKKLILFVGRFEYGKGSDVIIKALPDIIKENCEIVVAANSSVDLPGLVSLKNVAYNDLPFLYSACDLFIFPSRHEGCSLSLIEAMGCEVPFLVTDVGSVSEIIKHNHIFNNWVSTLDNFPTELLARVKNISEERGYAERKLAKELFSYESFSQKYLKLLDSLVNKQKSN